MATLDMTAFASALKTRYTPEKIQSMTYQNHPFLALLPKKEDALGKSWVVPVHIGNPMGASATFATAQANKTASILKDFTVTRNHDYVLADIDNETLLSSQGDANAFVDAVTWEIDQSISQAARRLSIDLFGKGSGSIGQVYNSGAGSSAGELGHTVLLLGNSTDGLQPDDVVHFEVGQVIVASSTDGGGSVRSGTLTVSAVDRMAGTVTMTQALSTGISAVAQNDYLFVQGDYDLKIKGLKAWNAYDAAVAATRSTAAAASFFGTVRSSDTTRLMGVVYDGRGMPLEESLIGGDNLCRREGGAPDTYVISYTNMSSLVKSLGSRVVYVQTVVPVKNDSGNVVANIGFDGIKLKTGGGEVTVLADADCPNKYGWLLQKNTWKLYSLGKAPRILETDGNKILRASASDGVEVRIGYYGQLVCNAPAFNACIQLA